MYFSSFFLFSKFRKCVKVRATKKKSGNYNDDDVIGERLSFTGNILRRLERWTLSLTTLALLTFYTFGPSPLSRSTFPVSLLQRLVFVAPWLLAFFAIVPLVEGRTIAGRSENPSMNDPAVTFFPSCLLIKFWIPIWLLWYIYIYIYISCPCLLRASFFSSTSWTSLPPLSLSICRCRRRFYRCSHYSFRGPSTPKCDVQNELCSGAVLLSWRWWLMMVDDGG